MRSNVEPKRLDPEATREAILLAAEHVFSRRGFAATSLQQIADHAGVTKSLVAYHFANKETLWRRTLTEAIARQLRGFLATIPPGGTATLRDLVAYRFRVFEREPHLNRLLAWMSLEENLGPIDPPEEVAMARGRIVGDLSPERLLALVTSIDGWFRFKSLYSRALALDVDDPELNGRFLAELQSFAEGAR